MCRERTEEHNLYRFRSHSEAGVDSHCSYLRTQYDCVKGFEIRVLGGIKWNWSLMKLCITKISIKEFSMEKVRNVYI